MELRCKKVNVTYISKGEKQGGAPVVKRINWLLICYTLDQQPMRSTELRLQMIKKSQ